MARAVASDQGWAVAGMREAVAEAAMAAVQVVLVVVAMVGVVEAVTLAAKATAALATKVWPVVAIAAGMDAAAMADLQGVVAEVDAAAAAVATAMVVATVVLG